MNHLVALLDWSGILRTRVGSMRGDVGLAEVEGMYSAILMKDLFSPEIAASDAVRRQNVLLQLVQI
jgi:hypothetical protein